MITRSRRRRTPSGPRPARSARALAGTLAAAALVLAGCGSDAPTVTFDVGGTSLTAAPTQFCDTKLENCADAPNARVTAPVPAGTQVRITVPEEVSSAPWQVVYAYTRGTDPAPVQQRSPIAAPGTRTDFTVALPEPGDRLVTAQVQVFGAPPSIDPASADVQFPVRATWVLVGEQPG
ncbi:DUF2771 family protein [Pseudonocardia spirodelae]|uniref:DUF2771 family protein n=1 Tax=Pseudonocardia spirodelae TaxID=3133431 RepID=A0ABU8TA26_9PSEU